MDYEPAWALAERNGLFELSVTPPAGEYIQSVWARRYYAWKVPVGDWRSEHFDTLLGNFWHLLNPLFFIGIYYLFFGILLGTKSGISYYITYLAIGLFFFRYTETSVTTGSGSIVSNEGLIRSIYFPRALLPISAVVYQTLVFLPSLAVIFLIALLNGVIPQPTWILIPVILVWQGFFNLGGAFYAARITHRFRDFPQLLGHFFRALFYMSAPMYSVQALVHNKLIQNLFYVNPMYAFLVVARFCFFGSGLTFLALVSITFWTFVAVVGGFSFFRAAEHTYGRG